MNINQLKKKRKTLRYKVMLLAVDPESQQFKNALVKYEANEAKIKELEDVLGAD